VAVAVNSAVATEELLNFADCLEKFAGVCKSIKLVLKVESWLLICAKAEILTADLVILASNLFTGTFSASMSPLTMPATSSVLPAREELLEVEDTAMI
jgi:hypothetical protein